MCSYLIIQITLCLIPVVNNNVTEDHLEARSRLHRSVCQSARNLTWLAIDFGHPYLNEFSIKLASTCV